MLDLNSARDVMLREVDAALARLQDASDRDWQRPVRCEGWTVRDLGHHLATGTAIQAEAYRRGLAGITEPPAGDERAPGAPAAILGDLRDARDRLARTLAALGQDALGAMVPLPFATLPGAVAMQASVLELGVHRNDLEWALGNEQPLPHDIAGTIVEMSGAMLPVLAAGGGMNPEAPIAFRITAPEQEVSLVFREGGWQPGNDPSVSPCEIAGDASALALFLLGRIPADHPSLKTSGQAALARRFKAYFPGP